MAGFVQGVDRGQSTLFPALLDDYVAEDNPVRGKDTGVVGYNVQIAVDTQHHLIVAHEVTNVGTDRHPSCRRTARQGSGPVPFVR